MNILARSIRPPPPNPPTSRTERLLIQVCDEVRCRVKVLRLHVDDVLRVVNVLPGAALERVGEVKTPVDLHAGEEGRVTPSRRCDLHHFSSEGHVLMLLPTHKVVVCLEVPQGGGVVHLLQVPPVLGGNHDLKTRQTLRSLTDPWGEETVGSVHLGDGGLQFVDGVGGCLQLVLVHGDPVHVGGDQVDGVDEEGLVGVDVLGKVVGVQVDVEREDQARLINLKP